MKKILLQLFAVAILSVSCASEDLTVQNNSERKVITLNKSTEMLDFEKSLKDYFCKSSAKSGLI